jgi:ferredoxin-thioredoxin reductase catalytic subunit
LIVRTNPDKEHVKKVKKALKKNDGYCPCQIKSPQSICICKDFSDMMENGVVGSCHCNLYRVVEK